MATPRATARPPPLLPRLEIGLDSGDIYRLTVSVGVYFAHAASFDLAEMVSRADRAMYEAKRAGRNRVVVAEP